MVPVVTVNAAGDAVAVIGVGAGVHPGGTDPVQLSATELV